MEAVPELKLEGRNGPLSAALAQPVVFAIVVIIVLLRVATIFHYPVNSDEPQHLHVAWEWTAGSLPYRDFFDNHAPLFHILLAPVLSAFGERSDIVPLMRLAMLPIFAGSLLLTWRIGWRLFGLRAAAFAALLVGVFPPFFFRSLEFRADDLWVMAWLATLCVLVGGPLGFRRALAAGLLAGAAVATSLKSVALLAALLVGTAAFAIACPAARAGFRPGRIAAAAFGFLSGLLLIPAALAAFFALNGAWSDLVACTVSHNLGGNSDVLERAAGSTRRSALVALGLATSLVGFLRRTAPAPQRWFTFVAAAAACVFAIGWSVLTSQTLLCLHPVFAVLLAGWLAGESGPETSGSGPHRFWTSARVAVRKHSAAIVALLAVGEILAGIRVLRDGGDRINRESAVLDAVASFTDPGDTILDAKGEAIFRHRATYHVFELFTKRSVRAGTLADDGPESCIATGTGVALNDPAAFPDRTRKFLEEQYLPAGPLRVAGRLLDCAAFDGAGPVAFSVVIPGVYWVLSERGGEVGALDGIPFVGARFLAAGTHALFPSNRTGRVAIVWARAAAGGFDPFATRTLRDSR